MPRRSQSQRFANTTAEIGDDKQERCGETHGVQRASFTLACKLYFLGLL